MEKYCQIAYEAYRQDTPTGYLSYADFKKKLCGSSMPWWLYVAGGAAVGYAIKK